MPRPLIFVAGLAAVFSLAPLDIDMYLPALPAMAAGLGASIDDLEASVSIFLLGYAISQLVFGPLSDRFGRRPVLLAGLAMFVIGSVLCGLAADVGQLYAFRFLQALGGGASVVVFPLVKDRFDERSGAQIISYIMAVVVVAPVIAPLIGGYALVTIGWPPIFFGLAAYGAVTLLTVRLLIEPSSRATPKAARRHASGLRQFLGSYGEVLTNVPAMAHILIGSFAFAGLFAFVAGSPFVYITYFDVPPQNYGYLVGLNALVMIAMNIANARLLADVRPTSKAVAGAVVIGGVGALLFAVEAAGLGLVWIIICVSAYVGALGLVAANAVAGALSHVRDDSGTGSAVYGVFNFGLGALSSLIVSALDSTDASVMAGVMAACGLLALMSAIPLVAGPFAVLQKQGSPS